MIDMYLKFTDEAQAIKALEGYEGNIDVIGVISKRIGGTDEEPLMKVLSGWHVNVRGPLLPALQKYAVKVTTPVRVWA